MMERAFAPGKLVLLGEYAVLDGAPCLSMAVVNGVVVERRPAATLRLETPDGDARFVAAALEAAGVSSGHYRFEDARPRPLPGKPGLGGSAAAVVAALLVAGVDRERLLPLALQVHRRVQGSGSGVDVATSATGGTIRFCGGAVRPVQAPRPVVIYSGRSARTGPRVRRYRAWAGRSAFIARSTELVDGFCDDPVGAVREAWRLLRSMAVEAGIAYATPAIEHIVARAEAWGGAAKPSGAGGGDAVVVWVDDPGGFRVAMEAEGFTVLDVEPSGPPWRASGGERGAEGALAVEEGAD